jgi:hypothetical protein
MTDSIDKRLHSQLQADGYYHSGEIMRNQAGDVALVELGVVRKLDLDQFFEIMHAPIKKYICVVCGIKLTSPKTLMHNGMHRYVCSIKCMSDFYTASILELPIKKPACLGRAGES